MKSSLPILEQLKSLKIKHEQSKVNSAIFQPSKTEQEMLIAKNATAKLAAIELRKETQRLAYNEAMRKLEEKRIAEMNSGSENNSVTSGSRAQTAPVHSANKAAHHGHNKQSMKDHELEAHAPNVHQPHHVRSHFDHENRPSTAGFASLLKERTAPLESFDNNINYQIAQHTKNSKNVFACLTTQHKQGHFLKFTPKSTVEVCDVTQYVIPPEVSLLKTSMKLEDLQNKKRDGMCIILDPTTNTYGHVLYLHIVYNKQVSFGVEEECSKDIEFYSSGNYFGLNLCDDYNAGSMLGSPQKSEGASSHNNSFRSPSRNSISEYRNQNSTSFPSLTSQEALNSTGSQFQQQRLKTPERKSRKPSLSKHNNASFSGGSFSGMDILETRSISPHSHDGLEEGADPTCGVIIKKGTSLPGWGNHAPIFIPATRCTIQILYQNEISLKNPQILFNMSKLKLYAITNQTLRQGMKRLNDFCDTYFQSVTANLLVPGGVSALNIAALHGNLDAVTQLVANGANINLRNKGSKYNTALHEAVIGGFKDVVKYLLENGANQLLKDETGNTPMHLACKLDNISVCRILINSPNGKRALISVDNNDQKPIDVCATNFIKIRVEGAMRKLKIFVKPRVSILDR